MKMPNTILVCKCGAKKEYYAAKAAGWLVTRKPKPEHGLIIRCPACREEAQEWKK